MDQCTKIQTERQTETKRPISLNSEYEKLEYNSMFKVCQAESSAIRSCTFLKLKYSNFKNIPIP